MNGSYSSSLLGHLLYGPSFMFHPHMINPAVGPGFEQILVLKHFIHFFRFILRNRTEGHAVSLYERPDAYIFKKLRAHRFAVCHQIQLAHDLFYDQKPPGFSNGPGEPMSMTVGLSSSMASISRALLSRNFESEALSP